VNWLGRWQAISARIVGLMEAANFLIQTYAIQNQNTGAVPGRALLLGNVSRMTTLVKML
jgi:hypothetical protein